MLHACWDSALASGAHHYNLYCYSADLHVFEEMTDNRLAGLSVFYFEVALDPDLGGDCRISL